MADDDDVAEGRIVLGKAHHSREHRLHGIALCSGNLEFGVVVHKFGLTHRQGERVFVLRHVGEVDAEGIAAVEQSGCGNTDGLLL